MNSKRGPWVICGAIAVLAAVIYGFGSHERPGFKVITVHPAGNVWDAALSPDGSRVAMTWRERYGRSSTDVHEAIEIKDVRSDKEIASFTLPPRNWNLGQQSSVDRSLQYCDHGKYLLAFAGPDALMAVDTASLSIHFGITLGTLPPLPAPDQPVRWLTFLPFSSNVTVRCSTDTPYVVLATWGDMQASSVKVFDLEKGTEVADLSRAYAGRYAGGGVAISPDGSRAAVETWSNANDGGQVEVIDISRVSRVSTLSLGPRGALPPNDSLAFAGNNAVLIGERKCQDGDSFCDFRPHPRVIRDWNFSADREARELSSPGAYNYQYFSGSADGHVAFSYSGSEGYCTSCNSGGGETKVSDARFRIWDRTSGRIIAESPRLKVEKHSCFLVITIGSCTSYERVPELQMSDDGKAVLAFMPLTSEDAPDRKPRPLLVFLRR
ncbi:MAG TPA: hypothetical protein VE218_14310 [Acidobacteriaceae bacterium]|nr:hypothetical protein [Acidobacteriaceae bacterium]